jgi:hypothetical protein
MDPATSIIKKLGGEALVSKITGTAFTAPYRWQQEKSKGGTGGLIPQRHHRSLLDYAHQNDIPFVAEEFLPAREAGANEVMSTNSLGGRT